MLEAVSMLHTALRRIVRGPVNGRHWIRVEMDQAVDVFLAQLDLASCDAIEVSGNAHARRPWRSYRHVDYPAYDLLDPSPLPEFDVVLCEQVLEHVPDPWRAMETLTSLCRPGGSVVITTPFLMRIHEYPADFWRFTPEGMAHIARGAGLEVVQSGSWGNTWCTVANRHRAPTFRAWHQMLSRVTLANDPLCPQTVWTFARKPDQFAVQTV